MLFSLIVSLIFYIYVESFKEHVFTLAKQTHSSISLKKKCASNQSKKEIEMELLRIDSTRFGGRIIAIFQMFNGKKSHRCNEVLQKPEKKIASA